MSQNKPKHAIDFDAVDFKIANALILTPRKTDKELATLLGLSQRTVNRRKNSESVQELLQNALKISSSEIQRLTVKALRKIEEHVDDTDPRISLAAAMHITKLAFQANERITEEPEKEQNYEIVYTTQWGNRTEPNE
jgi:DNA-binding Lrp family transcriptional regulator